MTPAYQSAYAFAAAGFPVFPCDGKEPFARGEYWRERNGRAFQSGPALYEATVNPQQIAAWQAQYPSANIGVAVPDGYAVVDVDPRNGGSESLAMLESQIGSLRDTSTIRTGGGGLHLWFRVPPGMALPSKLAAGIDVKQKGGYVIAPGSVNRLTGGVYEPVNSLPIASLPAALAARLTPRSEVGRINSHDVDDIRREQAAEKTFGVVTAEKAVQDVHDSAIEYAVETLAPVSGQGNRYTTLVKAGGMLNRLGWSAASVEAFARAYIDRYGGNDIEHGVRGCLGGMGYPSGYYDLIAMLPAWKQATFAGALDAIPNPYGEALREGREALLASVNTPLSAKARAELDAGIKSAQTAPSVHVGSFAQYAAADVHPDLAGNRLAECLDDDSDQTPILRLADGVDLADGIMTYVAAAPGGGKTPTAMLLALCLANKLPFGGRDVEQQRPVIYASFEKAMYVRSMRRRIAQGLEVDPRSVHLIHMSDKGYMLSAKGPMNPIGDLIGLAQSLRMKYGVNPVVVVDTYNNAVGGLDANDNAYVEPLRDLRNGLHSETQCPMVVLMHAKKSSYDEKHAAQPPGLGDIAGTGQLVGLSDAIIGLHRPDPKNRNIVQLTSVRAIGNDMTPITIEWCGDNDAPLIAKVVTDGEQKVKAPPRIPAAQKASDAANKLVVYLRTPVHGREREELTRDRIRGALGHGYQGHERETTSAVDYAIGVAVKEGLLEQLAGKRGRSAATYRRVPPPEQPYQNSTGETAAFNPALFMSLSGCAPITPR